MTTIINNPDKGDGGGMGLVIGAIVAIAIIALFIIYGLPALRGVNKSGTEIHINTPDNGGTPGPAPSPTP